MSVIISFGMLALDQALVITTHLRYLMFKPGYYIFFYRYLHLCLQTHSVRNGLPIHFDFTEDRIVRDYHSKP
jgi:hypothetical protein